MDDEELRFLILSATRWGAAGGVAMELDVERRDVECVGFGELAGEEETMFFGGGMYEEAGG